MCFFRRSFLQELALGGGVIDEASGGVHMGAERDGKSDTLAGIRIAHVT